MTPFQHDAASNGSGGGREEPSLSATGNTALHAASSKAAADAERTNGSGFALPRQNTDDIVTTRAETDAVETPEDSGREKASLRYAANGNQNPAHEVNRAWWQRRGRKDDGDGSEVATEGAPEGSVTEDLKEEVSKTEEEVLVCNAEEYFSDDEETKHELSSDENTNNGRNQRCVAEEGAASDSFHSRKDGVGQNEALKEAAENDCGVQSDGKTTKPVENQARRNPFRPWFRPREAPKNGDCEGFDEKCKEERTDAGQRDTKATDTKVGFGTTWFATRRANAPKGDKDGDRDQSLYNSDNEKEVAATLDPKVIQELDAKAKEMEKLNLTVMKEKRRQNIRARRGRILRNVLAPIRRSKDRSSAAQSSSGDNDEEKKEDDANLLREWKRDESGQNRAVLIWWQRTRLGLMMAKNMMKRATVGVVGACMVTVGVPLLVFPIPGPGLLMICGGLYVLSTEFDSTQAMLEATRDRLADVLKIVGIDELRTRMLEQGDSAQSTTHALTVQPQTSKVPDPMPELLPAQELHNPDLAKESDELSEEGGGTAETD